MISNRVILAILTVFLLAGCAVIYCVDNDDYTATVNTDSGGVDYTISGFMPCDYTFKVYSNTDVTDPVWMWTSVSMLPSSTLSASKAVASLATGSDKC